MFKVTNKNLKVKLTFKKHPMNGYKLLSAKSDVGGFTIFTNQNLRTADSMFSPELKSSEGSDIVLFELRCYLELYGTDRQRRIVGTYST